MMANKPPSTLNEFIGAASSISMAKLISEKEELREGSLVSRRGREQKEGQEIVHYYPN
jgi:hypothetical protein